MILDTMNKEDQDQQHYSLKWQAHSDHLKSMMKQLMSNDDFSDITLVTEDNKKLKANINILSSCSPVFDDVLKSKKENSPSQIMYLRGIRYSEMRSIMQFIYLGEATFYEERMKEFFDVARSLQIKELCNGAETESTNTTLTKENIRYDCEDCIKTFSDKHKLIRHRQSVHEGVKYPCELCDFRATRLDTLTRHIKSQHEGLKFSCHRCDHQASTQSNLTVHIQKMHEGVWYVCNHCGYENANHKGIRLHIQNKHEGVQYSPDQYTRKGL